MSRDRQLAPDHRSADAPVPPARRASNPVLALQQSAGNRAVGQMLARKEGAAAKGATIQLGKLAIEVAGGNISAWVANDVPDTLDVTSQKGPHSAELERLSTEHARVDSLTLTVAMPGNAGQNLDLGSLAIQITNAHIKGYKADGAAETWQVADFDGVHRTKTAHKVS